MASEETGRCPKVRRRGHFAFEEFVVTVLSQINRTLISDEDQRAVVCLKRRSNVEVSHTVPAHSHPISANRPYFPVNPRARYFATARVEIYPESFRQRTDDFRGTDQSTGIREDVFKFIVNHCF